LAEVTRLAADGRFDYLLIESTGISEPLPVAATFSFRDENDMGLSDVARLDTMVTVVDAINLLKDYGSHDLLRQRGESLGDDDHRTLVDLLVEQIEFADVVVINKIADVPAERRALVRTVVRALNADARIVEAEFGRVPLDAILNTGLFDDEKAQQHPLWFKELFEPETHTPETLEYGIASFVYRARRPFDPTKFNGFLARTWPGLIRAKGHFWLATRPNWVGEMSLAGATCRTAGRGFWWAAVPPARWPTDAESQSMFRRYWSEMWGDRRQELVFIGAAMDEAAIRAALDSCLVVAPTGEAFDAAAYRHLPDPFPRWERTAA
jgi:G3E family GTPase